MKKVNKTFVGVIFGVLIAFTIDVAAEAVISSGAVSYSNTTVSAALDELFSAVDINERLGTTSISGIGNGTITGAISAINKRVTTVKTAGTDLNDYLTYGYYFFSSTYAPTNIPAGVNGFLVVIPNASGGSVIKQIWYRQGTIDSNDHQTWVRTTSDKGETWSSWAKYYTSKDITGGASTILTSNLTKNRALVSDASGKVAVSAVTSTELGYLDGVTSNVQTQLNNSLGYPDYAGEVTVISSTGTYTVEEDGYVKIFAQLNNSVLTGSGMPMARLLINDKIVNIAQSPNVAWATYTGPLYPVKSGDIVKIDNTTYTYLTECYFYPMR